MGLSRLNNFLKSVKGNIIYVDPNSLDSTDSAENQGNSLTRPFKTLQRALIEAARFSYQKGRKNDRFLKTTILLYPGEHYIDNRPGWIPFSNDVYQLRSGAQTAITREEFAFDFRSNFDVFDATNDLYKFNSIYGGVVVPRGTSVVGLDLRKTKIRPLYVPAPDNSNIDRSAIFRVTGGCYFWQFTILDGDPNGKVYRDYTNNKVPPNFSHHKLTVFEYADGVNDVQINDTFLQYEATRSDLEIYYEKIALAYGPSTREISPDPSYPAPTNVDIEPVVDEYRVVGSKGLEVGINSIRSGNGLDIGTTDITVFLSDPIDSLSVDTAIQVSNVSDEDYNGQFAISEVINETTFKYQVPTIPQILNPTTNGSAVNIVVDTVSSASPYIFNCSLRSVWGLSGLHADGSKATGFKSMVVAQYTGIGLQKDERAFVKYNPSTGLYQDFQEVGNLQTDSRSLFKPEWENFHIKASNNAFVQLVSVFAIGFANHFLAESGGDHSITNSNSNFGARALVSKGFRDAAFDRDDCGYITHVVTPKSIGSSTRNVEYLSIDVTKTVSTITNPAAGTRLYLANETDLNNPPNHIIEGYRIGANLNELLYVEILNKTTGNVETATTPIVMEGTSGASGTNLVGQKKYRVGKVPEGNNIEVNVITLTTQHNLTTGESVIVVSDNGSLPDGLVHNKLYYVITSGSNAIKLAVSRGDALSGNEITLNKRGGNLNIISRVTDKVPNELGHPIQWDSTQNQWFITCDTNRNTIYNRMFFLNSTSSISSTTPKTFIKRTPDNRSTSDKVYKLRYVLPKENEIACRPPLEGYVLQESSNTNGSNVTIPNYITFNTTTNLLANPSFQRNFKFIAYASWSNNTVKVRTETAHGLIEGSKIKIYDIVSSNNTDGLDNLGFNGEFTVSKVSSKKEFEYYLDTNPGSFFNINTAQSRTIGLPRVSNIKYPTTFQIYRSEIIQEYSFGEQDGIYHLLVTNSSNSPSAEPFTDQSFSQPIQNLFPQYDRDNPESNPQSSSTVALSNPIGQTVVNDFKRSVTRETLDKFFVESTIGFGITNISSNSGTAHTIYTKIDHGLNAVTSLIIQNTGSSYEEGEYYNVKLLGTNTGDGATAAIKVSPGGVIDDVVVIDGGSSYQVGDLLRVDFTPNVGVSTSPSFNQSTSQATLRVGSISDNVDDVIRLSGITSHVNSLEEYNGYYRITSISKGRTKEFTVESTKTLGNLNPTGIGTEAFVNSYGLNIGKSYKMTSLSFNNTTGNALVGLTSSHVFRNGSRCLIYNADNNFYNGEYEVTRQTPTSINVKYESPRATPSLGNLNSVYVLPTGFNDANQSIENSNEFKSSRIIPFYDGFTSSLQAAMSESSTLPIQIFNSVQGKLNIGDYLLIDDEIVRISERVTDNSFNVIRGILGTKRQSHAQFDIVRRIKPKPVETRRNSIIRASGHTFEYLGFGPGNYSTSLPERQDRILSPQEEVLSQSFKENGGTVLYTGMNSDGDLYNNNKKLTSNGQDQLFDSPIPTVTGEEPPELFADGGYNLVTPSEVTVSRSIKIEGGPESNLVSEINGPLVINEKMTSTSEDGIEVRTINLRGNLEVSRNIGISTLQPTNVANVSDISFNAFAKKNSNVGWVYTAEDKWEKFGWINDNLYGSEFRFSDPSKPATPSFNLIKGVDFRAGSGVAFEGLSGSYPIVTDTNSGIATVILSVSADVQNRVGIRTGTTLPNEDYTSNGIITNPDDPSNADYTTVLKFASSDIGFGVRISTLSDALTGVTTISYESPLVPVSFGYQIDTQLLGYNPPQTAGSRSAGTRIILEDYFGKIPGASDFSIGIDDEGTGSTLLSPKVMWFGLPDTNTPVKSFRWYGGTTQLMELNNQKSLTLGLAAEPTGSALIVYGDITGSQFKSTTTTRPPLTVANANISGTSSNYVPNLHAQYLNYADGVNSAKGVPTSFSNTEGTIPVRSRDLTDPSSPLRINATATGLLDGTSVRDTAYLTNITARLGYTPFDLTGQTVDGHSTFRQISDFYQYKTDADISTGTLTFDFSKGPLGIWRATSNNNLQLSLINIPTGLAANSKVTGAYSTTNREGKAYNFTWIIIADNTALVPINRTDYKLQSTGTNPTTFRWLNGKTPGNSGTLTAGNIYTIGLTIFFDINDNNVFDVIASYSEYR